MLGLSPSPFAGDPNATTIGKHSGGNAVTIDNAATLKAFLPAGGPSGSLTVSGDAHYDSPSDIPDPTGGGTGSKGSGGGTLSGQAMAMGLSLFLSGKTVVSVTYPAGLGDVMISSSGNLLCTGRGSVCEAFSFPVCAQGKKVSEIRDAANNFLVLLR